MEFMIPLALSHRTHFEGQISLLTIKDLIGSAYSGARCPVFPKEKTCRPCNVLRAILSDRSHYRIDRSILLIFC